jgi:hypothetical protein
MNIPKLIEEIVKKGVPVSLKVMDDGRIGFDLDTQAKSGVILTVDDPEAEKETFTAHMRYDKTEKNITDIFDVICTVKDAMHGRDFVASHWIDIFLEYGYAKEEVKTTRTIHF